MWKRDVLGGTGPQRGADALLLGMRGLVAAKLMAMMFLPRQHWLLCGEGHRRGKSRDGAVATRDLPLAVPPEQPVEKCVSFRKIAVLRRLRGHAIRTMQLTRNSNLLARAQMLDQRYTNPVQYVMCEIISQSYRPQVY